MDPETQRLVVSIIGAAITGLGGIWLGQRMSLGAARRERLAEDRLRRIDDTALYVSQWRDWAYPALGDENPEPLRRELWPRADLTIVGDAAAMELLVATVVVVERDEGQGIVTTEVARRIEESRTRVLTALEKQRDIVLAGDEPTIIDRARVAAAFEGEWQKVRDERARIRANLDQLEDAAADGPP